MVLPAACINTDTYDALGRLKTVTQTWRGGSDITDETTSYAYDLVGNLDMQVTEWNDVVADYQYDALNRLEMLTHYYDENDNRTFDGIDEERAKFEYEYQLDGARTQVVETDDLGDETTITWEYDGLGRLVSETSASDNDDRDYSDIFTYDLASNRLTQERTGTTSGANDFSTDYLYDANDRLTTELKDLAAGTDTNTVYSYDNTVQTSKTVREGLTPGSGTKVSETTYHYDATGRMVQVDLDTDGDGNVDSTQTYSYDARGLRVSQTDNATGETTTYLFDPQNHTGYAQVLEEYVDSGSGATLEKTYTLGHDVIAQASAAASQILTLLHDGHGSTRAVVDEVGDILQRYAYDAYGVQLEGTGLTSAANALTTLLYSGEAFNAATGLQYLRARWYNPSTGRFNRLDPFAGNTSDPVSLHKYLYAHANPVMGVDPSGMFLTLIGQLAVLCIRAIVDYALDVAARVAPAAYIASVQLGFIALRAYQMIPTILNGLLIGTVVLDVGFALIDNLTQNQTPIREGSYPLRPGEVSPIQRGRMIEDISGANLRGNVRGIDDFRQGVATSIKSYGTTDTKRLLAAIERDLRDLENATSKPITGTAYNGVRVNILSQEIQARQLVVALEENTTVWRDSGFLNQLRALSEQYRTAIRPTIVRFWTRR